MIKLKNIVFLSSQKLSGAGIASQFRSEAAIWDPDSDISIQLSEIRKLRSLCSQIISAATKSHNILASGFWVLVPCFLWIPAYAGMTIREKLSISGLVNE